MDRYTPPNRAKIAHSMGKKAPEAFLNSQTKEQRLANLAKGRETVARKRAEGTFDDGRINKKAARREALREMEPRALQVLRERMESMDERISMQAAMRVLEYTQGRPQAEVRPKEEEQQVVYESAVMDMLTKTN